MNDQRQHLLVPKHLTDLVDVWITCFITRDEEKFLDILDMPLAVYIDGDIVVHNTRQDLRQMTRALFDQLSGPGLQEVIGTIEAFSPRRGSKQSFVVAWEMIMVSPNVSVSFKERYMVRLDPETGAIKLSMIEYLSAPPTVLKAYQKHDIGQT